MSKKSQAASRKITDLSDRTDLTDKLKFTPEVCREMYDLLDQLTRLGEGVPALIRLLRIQSEAKNVLRKAKGEK